MNIYQEYNQIINNYSYFEDSIKKILRIFEGSGQNQIITKEIIPSNFGIKDFIVISDQIERGLNIIHKELREIQEENAKNSGSLFYFSQYGGSKTQFLNLVYDEVTSKIQNCITVLFEDVHHINPILIFKCIFSQIFQIIGKNPKLTEDIEKYNKFNHELQEKIGEVQIAIRQSVNLKNIEKILEDIRRIKNPNIRKKIEKLENLLHSTILVDPILIFSKIINLMQFCSQNGITFLFLFDEVDLWLEERGEQLGFSKDFNRKSKIMKYLFELQDNRIKNFFVFACTDRVNRLFLTLQHKFENTSQIATRLNRIYNNSKKVLEPGNYGSKIDKALVNLAAFYHLANVRFKIDNEFLQQMLIILENRFKSLSRRIANSKIIQILNDYRLLAEPLRIGLNEWKNNTQYYGKLIQKYLPKILKRLTIKFVREEIPVDNTKTYSKDRIDGYFLNHSLRNEEIHTHVEIKVSSDFKGKKAYQALQFLQLNPQKPLIMIIFSPTSLDKIKREIFEYAEDNGFNKKVFDRIHYIHIENPIAFTPIIGISTLTADTEKLLEFMESFANWFEFFSGFSQEYQQVKQDLDIDFIPPEKKIPSSDEEGGNIPNKPQFKLDTDQQTCLNLMSKLYHERKFTGTGRIYKSSIRKFIEKYSLGIMDIEKYFEIMKKANILENITDKTIIFSEKIVNVNSLDKLRNLTENLFQKESDSTDMMNFNI